MCKASRFVCMVSKFVLGCAKAVEAAGVENKERDLINLMMACDFWR